jgi:hypothetical protein
LVFCWVLLWLIFCIQLTQKNNVCIMKTGRRCLKAGEAGISWLLGF